MIAPTTRRARQKRATRTRLFDVAMRLFDHKGYDAVNIDDIVRSSKVARGTFYFHFPSKEDILYEAVRLAEREIVARMARRSERPFRDVLAAACDGFAITWGPRRELLVQAGVIGLRRTIRTAHDREEEPLRRELVRHVHRALTRGEIRSALPAQFLADMFLLNVFAALMAWAETGHPPLDVVMPSVIDLFLRGAEGFATPLRAARKKQKARGAARR